MAGFDSLAVDLDLLDETVEEMARSAEALDAVLDEVARRVTALQVTWAGVAAAAQKGAQDDWEAGFRQMRDALGSMRADLEAHVRAQGYTGDVRLGKGNDTPLRARADVFAAPVRERVDAYFHEDLERFGELWDFSRLDSVPPWSDDALSGLRAQIALSERIQSRRPSSSSPVELQGRLHTRLIR